MDSQIQQNLTNTVKSARLIFNELADVGETRGRWDQNARLVGSDGHVHTQEEMDQAEKLHNRGFGGTTRALDMFTASLNWIAYKTIYYSLAAKYLEADTFLHPIRQAYQIHWMRKSGVHGFDFTSKLVKALNEDMSNDLSLVIDCGRNVAVPIEIPIFSAYLISQSGNVRNIIDAALELKRESDFSEVRELLREIRIAYDQEGVKEANPLVKKWHNELRKASSALKVRYGVETPQGIPLSKILNVYNVFSTFTGWVQLPEIDLTLHWPQSLRRTQTRGLSSIYKNVAHELSAIDRLGSLREMLASQFKIDDEKYVPPKTEDPRYRRIKSDWKIPM